MQFLKTLIGIFSSWLSSPRVIAVFASMMNRPPADFSVRTARSLLVLKLDEIGDFVMVTSFLRELRRSAPQAEITLVVKPAVYNLAETCPYVNRVLIYDWQIENRRFAALRRHVRALRLSFKELRGRRFDAALIPRRDADTYFATRLAVLSGARAIVAYSETSSQTKRVLNRGYDRLVSVVVPPFSAAGHESAANLAMLGHIGATINSTSVDLWLTEHDVASANARMRSGCNHVAIATGASKAFKCWPASRFAELAVWLRDQRGFAPFILGAHDDPGLPGFDSYHGHSLREVAAMIARATFFVGNDSGLKHIAAGVHTPVVEINPLRVGNPADHVSSPNRFCAWGVKQRVIQPPDGVGEYAIDEISLEMVQTGIDGLLREIQGRFAAIS